MAQFFSVPSHNGVFNAKLIERVYINRAGQGIMNVSSNATIVAPGRFSTEGEVLEIIKAIWDHPDFMVEWQVAANSISNS